MPELDEQIRELIDLGAPAVTAREAMESVVRGSRRSARLVLAGRGSSPSGRYLVGALITVAAVIVLVLVLVLGFRGTSKPGGVTPTHRNKNNTPGVSLRFVAEGESSASGLKDDVAILTKRLSAFGLGDSTVSASRDAITIRTPAPVSKTAMADIVDLTSSGTLYLRPVLCGAPAYSLPDGTPPGAVPNRCPALNQLTAPNLAVNTSTGSTLNTPPPWATLAAVPTTPPSADIPTEPVLLVPSANESISGPRLLLGAAEVTGSDIASAQVAFDSPDWVLDISFNHSGSGQWNALAQRQFHALIGFDLDGQLLEAPLTEPSQATFTSFGSKVQISGPWKENQAKVVAAELNAGPLPVHLVEKHG
ncbi:MAG: hypothetical protein WAM97_00480 [Acidimicrobiales bacterium]